MSEPTPATDPAAGARAYELDRAHVFHSWSAQGALAPMTFAGGSGSYVWDFEGTRYLDFSSQLVNTNIGHQHPKVIAAIQEQAGTLATIAPQHANAARGEAARLIAELAPDGMNKVFFTNGGADANENAIRMARLSPRPATPGAGRTSTPRGTSTSSAPTCTGRTSGPPRPRRSRSAPWRTWPTSSGSRGPAPSRRS